MRNKIILIREKTGYSRSKTGKTSLSATEALGYQYLQSHPNGFINLVQSKELLNVWLYKNILHSFENGEFDINIRYLKMLLEQVRRSHYPMPLNTSRVLIALVKEAIKNQHDHHRSLEYLALFKKAVKGRPNHIRRSLKKLNLIELPENKPLKEIDLAWDDRVYDTISTGRKSTVQLIIDAYIKGMSSITIAHKNILATNVINFGHLIGKIFDIDVRFCLEFIEGPKNAETRYLLYFPYAENAEDYISVYNDPELKGLFDSLKQNQKKHNRMIEKQIRLFNLKHLELFNNEFSGLIEHSPELEMSPLSYDELLKQTKAKYPTRIQLGLYLEEKYRKVLQNRLDYINNQVEQKEQLISEGKLTENALENLLEMKKRSQQELEAINHHVLRQRYFPDQSYDAVIPDFKEHLQTLSEKGGQIVIAEPLKTGIGNVVKSIVGLYPFVSGIEIFNTKDCFNRKKCEVEELFHLLEAINKKDMFSLEDIYIKLKHEDRLPGDTEYFFAELMQIVADNNNNYRLYYKFGSSSTGYLPTTPGMGFYDGAKGTKALKKKSQRNNLSSKINIPIPIGASAKRVPLLSRRQQAQGYDLIQKIPFFNNRVSYNGLTPIYSLGKISSFKKPEPSAYSVSRSLRMFKNSISDTSRNLMITSAGFGAGVAIPGYSIGPSYTALWLGITFLRHYITDMVANNGLNPANWRKYSFDINNASNSLFWTGLSIPLLKFVDSSVASTLSDSGTPEHLQDIIRFFSLSLVNGLYLYSHNLLRGMGNRTARLNLMRNFISFPIATEVSQFIGETIPFVVQSKIWSDVVGGTLEGRQKLKKFKEHRQEDFEKIFDSFISSGKNTAQKNINYIDLMYIWSRAPRGKSALRNYLLSRSIEEVEQLIIFSRDNEARLLLEKYNLDPAYKRSRDFLDQREQKFHRFLTDILFVLARRKAARNGS